MVRYEEILDLREVPLRKRDFKILEGMYAATKRGTTDKAKVVHSREVSAPAGWFSPSFKTAAQIDLDKFHAGLPLCPDRRKVFGGDAPRYEWNNHYYLDWDELIEEMFPEGPEYATLQEKIEDEFAQADGRC